MKRSGPETAPEGDLPQRLQDFVAAARPYPLRERPFSNPRFLELQPIRDLQLAARIPFGWLNALDTSGFNARELAQRWFDPNPASPGVGYLHTAAGIAQMSEACRRLFDARFEPVPRQAQLFRRIGSMFSPRVALVRLRSDDMIAVNAARREVVIKMQPFYRNFAEFQAAAALMAGDRLQGHTIVRDRLLSFTVDTAFGLFFRDRAVESARPVTPHFAIALDAFAAAKVDTDPATGAWGMAGDAADVALYQITERGDANIGMLLFVRGHTVPGAARPPDRVIFGSLCWQLAFTFYAAAMAWGFAHGDGHQGNVMVRGVAGTPYANRDWLYVLPGPWGGGVERYFVMTAADHANCFLEVIDFGNSHLVSAEERTRPLMHKIFAQNLAYFLIDTPERVEERVAGLPRAPEWTIGKPERLFEAMIAAGHVLRATPETDWTAIPFFGRAPGAPLPYTNLDEVLATHPNILLVGALDTMPPAVAAAELPPNKRPRLQSDLEAALASGRLARAPPLGHLMDYYTPV